MRGLDSHPPPQGTGGGVRRRGEGVSFAPNVSISCAPPSFGGFHLNPSTLDLLLKLLVPGVLSNFLSLEDVCKAINQMFDKGFSTEGREVYSSFI